MIIASPSANPLQSILSAIQSQCNCITYGILQRRASNHYRRKVLQYRLTDLTPPKNRLKQHPSTPCQPPSPPTALPPPINPTPPTTPPRAIAPPNHPAHTNLTPHKNPIDPSPRLLPRSLRNIPLGVNEVVARKGMVI